MRLGSCNDGARALGRCVRTCVPHGQARLQVDVFELFQRYWWLGDMEQLRLCDGGVIHCCTYMSECIIFPALSGLTSDRKTYHDLE